jgi:hypothetical protein
VAACLQPQRRSAAKWARSEPSPGDCHDVLQELTSTGVQLQCRPRVRGHCACLPLVGWSQEPGVQCCCKQLVGMRNRYPHLRLLVLQTTIYDVLEDQYSHTMASIYMQPYLQASALVQFCNTLDPTAYLSSKPSARQLAADVDSLGSWLAQLSASGHHISVVHIRSSSSSRPEDARSSGGSLRPSTSSSIRSSTSSGDGAGRRAATGLLDIDVTNLRPVLVEAGRAGLG